MKTVWKYELSSDDYLSIDLPICSKPLSVQEQYGVPQLWILVDPNENVFETRKFRFCGTGHPIKESNIEFIGTFQLYQGSFVGHLFEINE
jgi:hypothetical protein